MENCPICEKHKEKVALFYEDEHWIVRPGPFNSHLLGYVYIEPKRHVENWSDFTEIELKKIGWLIKKCETALRQLLNVERVYTVTISEAVRHIHFHVIPRELENDIKGLQLIKQVTQQTDIYTNKISDSFEYESFNRKIKQYFI
ncbi:HIT family protein [Rossellomorea vietnamensis]|uniref:HIT family protein n=1 Tax=Rossellomorea vietnamensis TaxID=218284 RepID=UPI003D29D455